MSITFIAEVGSNYNNSLELAKKYILSAKHAGADWVKFQTIRKEKLIAPNVRSGEHWISHPAWNSFANLELSEEWHIELKAEADRVGIKFLCTPLYVEAVAFLEKICVSAYKVASGDLTFSPLLREIGRTGKPVYLSTGASMLLEIDQAISTLQGSGSGPISLLHCVVSYPPRWSELNLKAIPTMKRTWGLPVGLSDHSPGSLAPLLGIALGAEVIEKHVTFGRECAGPDHAFAMTFEEFLEMTQQAQTALQALGTLEKKPSPSETERLHRFRRGVYDPQTYKPVPEGTEGAIWLRPDPSRSF